MLGTPWIDIATLVWSFIMGPIAIRCVLPRKIESVPLLVESFEEAKDCQFGVTQLNAEMNNTEETA